MLVKGATGVVLWHALKLHLEATWKREYGDLRFRIFNICNNFSDWNKHNPNMITHDSVDCNEKGTHYLKDIKYITSIIGYGFKSTALNRCSSDSGHTEWDIYYWEFKQMYLNVSLWTYSFETLTVNHGQWKQCFKRLNHCRLGDMAVIWKVWFSTFL